MDQLRSLEQVGIAVLDHERPTAGASPSPHPKHLHGPTILPPGFDGGQVRPEFRLVARRPPIMMMVSAEQHDRISPGDATHPHRPTPRTDMLALDRTGAGASLRIGPERDARHVASFHVAIDGRLVGP